MKKKGIEDGIYEYDYKQLKVKGGIRFCIRAGENQRFFFIRPRYVSGITVIELVLILVIIIAPSSHI